MNQSDVPLPNLWRIVSGDLSDTQLKKGNPLYRPVCLVLPLGFEMQEVFDALSIQEYSLWEMNWIFWYSNIAHADAINDAEVVEFTIAVVQAGDDFLAHDDW